MTQTENSQTLSFQAEVKQLLHLMIHSLYSNKEIFLRELISNASDACDRLRFESVTGGVSLGDDSDFKIRVSCDAKARTVTVDDNGVGMSRDELVANLGTIARSGTAEFLASLTGDEKTDARLIGQFGVGFYSSFVVADKVSVSTRKGGVDESWLWTSTGEGEFTIDPDGRDARGTTVTLHLREGEDEFLDSFRLRTIIKKYSDHIGIPVELAKDDGDGFETVNRASALWTRPKQDITDDEYTEFYKHVSHDFSDPLAWTHNRVEGRHEYMSLLYVPERAPFDLWDRDNVRGVRLFVQRVFIMDDASQLLPRYLRFVRGVVDSNDLPLNVSREMLQGSRAVDAIRSGSTRKILGLLDSLAKNEPEKYQAFWDVFGAVLKEGPGEDAENAERIGGLLRFASTRNDGSGQTTSFADYVGRMLEGQDKIFYITADSHAAAANSPHLEVFNDKGIEVLLLSDRVDEWLVAHLPEFDGKKLVSVTRGELDLGDIEGGDADKPAPDLADQKDFVARVQSVLRDDVEDVRVSARLTRSPACIVAGEEGLGSNLERLLKEAGQDVPVSKPVLELNSDHPMVRMLKDEQDKERFEAWSRLLLEQAVLAEGGQLDNPAEFVRRVNDVILSVSGRS